MVRYFAHVLIGSGLLLLSSCSHTKSQQERLVRGAAIWQQCTICHGTREMQRGPLLEGREAWYVSHQLEKFKSGLRGKNPQNKSEHLMGSAMDKLPDSQAIRDVALYIESLQPVEHRKTVRGDVQRGQKLYQNCATCHGAQAEGKQELNAPRLAGIEDWYVADQLRKYIKDRRGQHLQDYTGQAMRAAVHGLSSQDVKDLTAYIASIPTR